MPGLIVIAFVLPEHLQKGNASGGKKKIGTGNDQNYGDKDIGNHLNRSLNRYSNSIPNAKAKHTKHSKQPFCFGFPFSNLSTFQQFNRIGKMNLPHAI